MECACEGINDGTSVDMFYQPLLDFIVLDGKASPREFMVFCLVAKHMNREGKNAFPSTNTIAFQAHISRRHVQRSLKVLVLFGYLEASPLKRRSTEYRLGEKLLRVVRHWGSHNSTFSAEKTGS